MNMTTKLDIDSIETVINNATYKELEKLHKMFSCLSGKCYDLRIHMEIEKSKQKEILMIERRNRKEMKLSWFSKHRKCDRCGEDFDNRKIDIEISDFCPECNDDWQKAR